ncbi:MAG: fatty acid metabolism transcriptional regulator FadR [Ignavibacteriales bacterium]
MRVKEGNKEKDILEAAIKIFAEDGYHNAKISKIADTARVATGSVYVYFKNKEDILQKIFEDLWEKLFNELNSLSTNKNLSPIEKIDSMIDLVFDVFTENSNLAIVFVNEQNNLQRAEEIRFQNFYEKFLDLGEAAINQGITDGVFSDTFDIKVFRIFILGALRSLLQIWAHNPKELPLNKIRQSVKYLIKNGIQK